MRMTVKAVRSHKTFPLFILLLQFQFVLLCSVGPYNNVLFYYIYFSSQHDTGSAAASTDWQEVPFGTNPTTKPIARNGA